MWICTIGTRIKGTFETVANPCSYKFITPLITFLRPGPVARYNVQPAVKATQVNTVWPLFFFWFQYFG